MPEPAIERRRHPRLYRSFALEELYRLSRQGQVSIGGNASIRAGNVLPDNNAARRWRAAEFPPDRPGGIM